MHYQIILTTSPSIGEARRLAGLLLKKKAAACITISSRTESYYRWKGKIEKNSEYLLLIKTRKKLYPEVQKIILENHPYDVPEIIALPIRTGSAKYLKWIDRETA